MPPRDWAFRIQDILDAISKIQRYVSGMDIGSFENNEETMDAVIHNLTVIGEAATRPRPSGDWFIGLIYSLNVNPS